MDELLLPMRQEMVVLLTAAWTSLILNDRVDQGRDEFQSAQEEEEVVEEEEAVWDGHVVMANLNVMNCCDAIFGSVCNAKRTRNK